MVCEIQAGRQQRDYSDHTFCLGRNQQTCLLAKVRAEAEKRNDKHQEKNRVMICCWMTFPDMSARARGQCQRRAYSPRRPRLRRAAPPLTSRCNTQRWSACSIRLQAPWRCKWPTGQFWKAKHIYTTYSIHTYIQYSSSVCETVQTGSKPSLKCHKCTFNVIFSLESKHLYVMCFEATLRMLRSKARIGFLLKFILMDWFKLLATDVS